MFECATCDDEFWDQSDCDDHMDDYDHWAECETCPRLFRSHRACSQHMNDLDHWAPTFDCETCQPCGRRFNNEGNLRAHLNSRIHRGTELSCPFCDSKFVSASGVSHHLETGSCANAKNLNRESIAKLVRRADPNGIITNKQIEWHDQGAASTYTATNAAYNGQAWECYMCHREFMSSRALNQHANSPVHQQSIYHCPNLARRCGKQFVSLAGFFNHLESESCGFIRFEKVQAAQRQLTEAMSGKRMIAGVF
ncbi:hypothetical protein F1880_008543 [Penicillium rolfsii]|nr:hypothetical protein F1880_008543 [Penicillium rolfsii]